MLHAFIFGLLIDGQEISVCYRTHYLVGIGYALFEFKSPHGPLRPIPMSMTGYKSHFAPRHEVEGAPSVEEYALVLARKLTDAQLNSTEAEPQPGDQLTLF